jgi:hypothetical protein
MSEIIKTYEIPHDELVIIYEKRCEDLKKEYDINLRLKAENKRLQSQISELNNRFRKIFNESKIALSE